MSVISNNQLAGAAGQGGADAGYTIQRSLRFNSADSAHLSRTPSSAGNRKTWTWSGWVKRSKLGTYQRLFEAHVDASNMTTITWTNADQFECMSRDSASNSIHVRTDAVYRDVSAWYHFVVVVDTTAAANTDKCKLYVNGVLQDATYYNTTPDNYQTNINRTIAHYISSENGSSTFFDGYLANIDFIDGQALAPTDFGEFDTNNIWQPKAYTGSYGTNGFHLDYSDNSSNAALGTDSSGNSNDWTVNNIAASGVTYTTNVSAAVNGTVPAPGNPYWIDIVPSNANLNYSSNSTNMNNVFDGSLSTYVYWVGDQYSVGNVLSATFDLRAFTTITSLRINHNDLNNTPYSAELLDSDKNVISGTTTPLDLVTAWASIPVSGTPRYLRIFCTSGSSRRLRLYAIEINGSILTNELASDRDSLVDSPTNGTQTDTGVGGEVVGNYCTLNPIFPAGSVGYDNGNLDANGNAQNGQSIGTIAPSSGKWYYEVTLTGLSSTDPLFGISKVDDLSGSYPGAASTSYAVYNYTSNTYISKVNNGSYTNTNTTVAVQGDVIGVAFDLDNGKFWISKNNTWVDSGNPAAGTNALFSSLSGSFVPAIRVGGSNTGSCTLSCNFGQRPFAYTAPSGFKALCTTNLPTPTIADGSTAMDVVTYAGTGSAQSIDNLAFQPDLVWIKARANGGHHVTFDTIRGPNKAIHPSLTDAEATYSATLTSFDSSGFSLGSDDWGNVNTNNRTYVAWTWDGGSSTVTNTDGSITSQVRANPSAGFSVVTFTCPSSGAYSFGHGLGVAPSLVILKDRGTAGTSWAVYHSSVTSASQYLTLNSTVAITTTAGIWGAGITGNVVGSTANIGVVANSTAVAYCFAPVEGFSAFGTYIGTGSASTPPFVFTGFRPRWVTFKKSSSGGVWVVYDTARDTFNLCDARLRLGARFAESASDQIDILSNGFMPRTNGSDSNESGSTYIYAAFAEHPFKTARAR